jgi:hypothetical protein
LHGCTDVSHFGQAQNSINKQGNAKTLNKNSYMKTPLTDPIIPFIESYGVKLAPLSSAVSAFLRLASDPTINGRCLLVGPDRVFDVRDDFEGLDGALEMRAFVREGNIGRDKADKAWGKEEVDIAGQLKMRSKL